MRNAFSGYSYQQQVTFLLLTIMDVERNISKIEIEANTEDKFDDLIITIKEVSYQFQIKDFKNVKIDDLKIQNDDISIKKKSHKLSKNHNIIFFKKIRIDPNVDFLGLKGFEFDKDVWIVSLSRKQIQNKINKYYSKNIHRKYEIENYFNFILDNRVWEIHKDSLPSLNIFDTELQEKSILISHKLLKFENLLLIEGKPGVGKSHFVNTLIKKYKKNFVYRFWISNQDKDYEARLKFENFIRDLNYKLFNDQKERTQQELIKRLKSENKIFIIDGLDHVLNYNPSEFDSFIEFIENTKLHCRIIVLSRPLSRDLKWKKHVLENWNLKQTEKVLKRLFHLSEYSIIRAIFKFSKGYPILVKYLAEHYKIHKEIPRIGQVENINCYYANIISTEKGKQALSLFLSCSSYLMKSEIGLFVGDEKYYIEEFISEHPYLFDIKLNRISLLHDSFNTYLKKHVNYSHHEEKVNKIVHKSIVKNETRFLSRFRSFKLSAIEKKNILTRNASIDNFEKLMYNVIDIEALRSFITQLRETLPEFSPNDFTVLEYYNLSLIINLITRDHLGTLDAFNYTFLNSLIANGMTDEDITSSGYLFGMYYFLKTNNATALYNTTASDSYDVKYFYSQLEYNTDVEDTHISKHNYKLHKRDIEEELSDKMNFIDNCKYVVENVFIHNSKVKGFESLRTSLDYYIEGRVEKACIELYGGVLHKFGSRRLYSSWILKGAYENLLSYGYRIDNGENEYLSLSLRELIHKHKRQGSFELRKKIHSYIRLALYNQRGIDIQSIHLFWTKFYERKDYTISSLPIALKIMLQEKIITLASCIDLIINVQENSEKGHRHLLSEFIELNPPSKIIQFLEKNYDVFDLRVEWFELKSKYINKISDELYHYQENKLFDYHSNSNIPFEEIKNVITSNKSEKLKYSLAIFEAIITYEKKDIKVVKNLEHTELRFRLLKDQNYNSYSKQTSKERFNQGILTSEDKKFIIQNNMKPDEVVRFADGNYISLADLKVFEIFKPIEVKRHFQSILYNSLISKTQSINYHHAIFMHPGNVLVLINKYRNRKEFYNAVISFKKFLELSFFELALNRHNLVL